jgi:nucleoside-diphosphate-sugar epimerase
MTRRALVLGDRGFLGRHFAAHLDARGWHVAGLDLARGPTDDLRRRLPSMVGDWDLVVHAAAVTPHRHAIDTAPLALAENLELDAVVFRWAAKVRPARLLYLSSSAVYPVGLQHGRGVDPNPQLPPPRLTELDAGPGLPGLPDQVYGWRALTGERLAQTLQALGGVAVTVVRPFSGYGSDQAPEFPFGAFLDRALARVDPFEVWGDGRQVRDFIHVDDLVTAALLACDAGWSGPLNLCTGVATSLQELAAMVCKAAGYQPEIIYRPDQPTGVRHRVGDPTRMRLLHPPKVRLASGIVRGLVERRYPQPTWATP